MPLTKFEVELNWKNNNQWDPKLKEWAVYAVPKGSNDIYRKGDLVKTVAKHDQSTTIELLRGTWVIRVIPRGADGSEPPLGVRVPRFTIRVDESDLQEKINTPTNVVATPVSSQPSTIATDAVDSDDPADTIQVIEGPSVHRGHLVAEVPVQDKSVTNGYGGVPMQQQFPMIGYGRNAARTMHYRGKVGNHPGPAGSANFWMPGRDDAGLITIATIEATGAAFSRTNFPAATSTDEWEEDITDGIRLREIPTTGAAGTEWEDKVTGLLANVPTIACYLPALSYESDEVDHGFNLRGFLDIYHEIQRKTDSIAEIEGRRWKGIHNHPDEIFGIEGTENSVAWLQQQVRSDGKWCNPLRPQVWVKWGTSSPISMGYVMYVPGMFIPPHRYMRLRFDVEEPSGLGQIICPKIDAKLQIPYIREFGSGTVVGSTASVTINFANDPVTGVSPFQNFVFIDLSMRAGGDRKIYVSAKTGTSFTVTHEEAAGTGTPATDTTFDWMAYGY